MWALMEWNGSLVEDLDGDEIIFRARFGMRQSHLKVKKFQIVLYATVWMKSKLTSMKIYFGQLKFNQVQLNLILIQLYCLYAR